MLALEWLTNQWKLVFIVPWCNGSTTDFGSVRPGSNPGGTTKNCSNHQQGKKDLLKYPRTVPEYVELAIRIPLA